MQKIHNFTIAEAEKIVQQLEDTTLPKEDWNHEQHLIVALSVVARFGKRAMPEMMKRIKHYNKSVGIINSESSGYHDTVTIFWIWAVWYFMSKQGDIQFNQAAIDTLFATDALTKRNIWLEYYSKDVMLSPDARFEYIEADVKPMPNIDYFFEY